MNYYVALNGSQAGPFTESQVREKIAAGVITGETLIWREGMVDWLPLGKALPSLLAASPIGKSMPDLSPAGGGWVLASLVSRLLAAVIAMAPLFLAVLILGMAMTGTGQGPEPGTLILVGGHFLFHFPV